MSSTKKITDIVVPAHWVTLQGNKTGIPSGLPCNGEKAEEDPALTVCHNIQACLFDAWEKFEKGDISANCLLKKASHITALQFWTQ